MDTQTQMKQIVADAAIKEVKSDMILGLGSGSTAALMIKSLAENIHSGKLQNIRGVATSFQSEVLALELNISLIDLASVSQIDLAIDGADEVDPKFQLIKGGGAKLKSIFSLTCRGSPKCMETCSGSYFRNEWHFDFKNGHKKSWSSCYRPR